MHNVISDYDWEVKANNKEIIAMDDDKGWMLRAEE